MNKLEGIEYLELSKARQTLRCAVFLHGYGANAQDLSGFHTLKLSASCRWIFPNSPLELASPYDVFGGRAWFPLKVSSENNRLYPNENSLYYLDKHCQQLMRFLQSLNVDFDNIIIGGFSQGAIMALNLSLRMDPPPRALVVMSGSLFPVEILNKEKEKFSKKGAFFQCHGKEDPLLLYSEAKEVCHFLQDLQWKGQLVSFEGGHEIPHEVLLQIQDFMCHKLS